MNMNWVDTLFLPSMKNSYQVLRQTQWLRFLSSISPGWIVKVLDPNRMVFTFRSWLDLLRIVLAFLDFNSIKSSYNFKTKNTELTDYRYQNLRKKKLSCINIVNIMWQYGPVSRGERCCREKKKKKMWSWLCLCT